MSNKILFSVFLFAATVISLSFPVCSQPANKNTYYSSWKNGLPPDSIFFPIAVFYQSASNAAAYKACGINTYIIPDSIPVSYLPVLKSAGIRVICYYNPTLQKAPDNDAIAGWMHVDEPDLAQDDGKGGNGPCIDPQVIQDLYTKWHTADPTRLIYLGLSHAVSNINSSARGSACHGRTDMYPEYIKGCDISAFDIYPCAYCTDPVTGNKLEFIPKGIDSLRMWADYKKPVFAIIETGPIHTTEYPGCGATPAQVRSEVWMALIHEAAGINYFCHQMDNPFIEARWLEDPLMKAAITSVNLQVAQLAPVLNSPTILTGVRIRAKAEECARFMTKIHEGCTYIFAGHERNVSGSDTFFINGISSGEIAEVLGENRTIPLVNGSFADSFLGYGVHIYKINGNAAVKKQIPKKTIKNSKADKSLLNLLQRNKAGKQEEFQIYDLSGKMLNGCGTVYKKGTYIAKEINSNQMNYIVFVN